MRKVLDLEKEFQALTNEQLQNKTQEFKSRLAKGESLDRLLPEAFAAVREASWRVLNKRPYPVQVQGGIALHDGCVTQMGTGEGKSIPMDTPLPTPSGWVLAEDVKVGDVLFGADGLPARVSGVYPKEAVALYELYLNDGRTMLCGEDHRWGVYLSSSDKKMQVWDTTEIEAGLAVGDRIFFPAVGCVDYPCRPTAILPFEAGLRLVQDGIAALEGAVDYEVNDRMTRRQVLRGAFAQAGCVKLFAPFKRPILGLDLPDHETAEFFARLCFSLGYLAYIAAGDNEESCTLLFTAPYQEWSFYCRDSSLDIPEARLKKLARTRARWSQRAEVVKVVNLGKTVPQVCFTVENDDHLFLAKDYIPTHNTLTSVMPAYLNALTGKGVHIVTTNDYLAGRDAQQMGKIHRFMGLTVGCIQPGMRFDLKKKAYQADITYGTNKEFGFDYLRDNMAASAEEQFQRGRNYAIIDEVDSILIDDARTPLIIAGNAQLDGDLYLLADRCVRTLIRGADKKNDCTKMEEIIDRLEAAELSEEEIAKKGDYTVDEQKQTVVLTDRGVGKVEAFFGTGNLGAPENTLLSHRVSQALRAHALMQRDRDYLLKGDTVQIVDASTGRVLDGRRFSDGLHQALEAKENVPIQAETITEAAISLQNFFRLYKKISGMTGTAKPEQKEFWEIYHMKVCPVPPNRPVLRQDMPDRIFPTQQVKFQAVTEDILACHKKGQPVLAGTPTIEQSEKLSRFLSRQGIEHVVLNAKNDEQEAEIVARAGRLNAVTISTNMAGRGTDILLGGNPEFEAMQDMLQQGYDRMEVDIAANMLPALTPQEEQLKQHYRTLLAAQQQRCAQEGEQVRQAGGLRVIGTARHDSVRIDNQLRGRAGRQGDPGSSQFYVSLDDDLMRIYGGERLKSLLDGSAKEQEIFGGRFLSGLVSRAQHMKEVDSFESRKATLEYDDVNNIQRQKIYAIREEILHGCAQIEADKVLVLEAQTLVDAVLDGRRVLTQDDLEQLNDHMRALLCVPSLRDEQTLTALNPIKARQQIVSLFRQEMAAKKTALEQSGLPVHFLEEAQKNILLASIDQCWQNYITALENLRDEVRLKGFGRDQPVDIYKRDASRLFGQLQSRICHEAARVLLSIRFALEVSPAPAPGSAPGQMPVHV